MAVCKTCGAKAPFLAELCRECEDKWARKVMEDTRNGDHRTQQVEAEAKAAEAAASQRSPSVMLATTPSLPGREISEALGIVTAECAFGMNLLRDLFAAVTDVVGGRSGSTQSVLRDARIACLADLQLEAARIGADAVVGVNLDYSELSGGGKSMLMLVASGTAVRLAKDQQV